MTRYQLDLAKLANRNGFIGLDLIYKNRKISIDIEYDEQPEGSTQIGIFPEFKNYTLTTSDTEYGKAATKIINNLLKEKSCTE